MKIRIHREAGQIGGCITEIESDSGTRILIDLGHRKILQQSMHAMSVRDVEDCHLLLDNGIS